ncbi:MAG: 30S ribosomal protein S1 [Acidimicrobiales bacterium]
MNHGDEQRPEQPAAAADHTTEGSGNGESNIAETPPIEHVAAPAVHASETLDSNEPAPVAETERSPAPAAPTTPAAAPAPEPSAPEPAAAPEATAAPVPKNPPAGPTPPAPEVGSTKPPAAPPVSSRRPQKPPGRVLEGAVTAVSADEVELTLDDGRPAIITRRNFSERNDDPTSVLSVGDRAFGAELARDDPKGRVVLSRAWALKRQAWDRIKERADAGEMVKGTVTSVGGKGVVVDVGVRGFVPSSHLELEPVTDLSSYKGQELELKVLECDPRRERLVLSRRSFLLKAQRSQAHELLTSLSPGDTCRGKVTSITDYGAFVDIGGVNGLVHLSELSWHRVRKPADIVSLGDELEVRVLDVKPKKRRVSLSLRKMQPDPLSELEVGEVRRGPVTRLVDFGAFVSLGDVEGLVHLSELAEYRVSAPEEIVTPGDEVGVKILSVDRKRRRVELSIRRAAEFDG